MAVKILRFFPVLVLLAIGLSIFVFLFSLKRATPSLACGDGTYSYIDNPKEVAIFETKKINVPLLAETNNENKVLGVADPSDRYIEIDLSEQKLKAWDGNELFLETLVSTGLPWTPTPKGEYNIQYKVRSQKMEGGSGKYYYNLPNVPYVMFFGNDSLPWSKGYGLHGTYWHNDFGKPHSHGCINLPTNIAEKLYFWTTPILPGGKNLVKADSDNLGTRVIIHE